MSRWPRKAPRQKLNAENKSMAPSVAEADAILARYGWQEQVEAA
jgi:hypothetical protein